ncbi:MAG TPA: Uma2 family endonuclease [Pyrinomonadaceae bacterium]
MRRDRVAKFQLYGKHRVGEYWLIDKDKQAVEIYRLHGDTLELTEVLTGDDELTTPVLPSFACLASQVFAMPPLFNG